VSEGDLIPADFDSMIAKIIAHGRTRDEALARLRRAVGETAVVIEGGVTNKSFLLELLVQPEIITAGADTGWIDRVRAEGRLVSDEHSGIALVAAAIEAYEDDERVEVSRLLETARGGRPQVQHRVARPVDLKLRGRAYRVAVSQVGPERFRVSVWANAQRHVVDVDVEWLGSHHLRLTASGRGFRVLTATHGPIHFVEVDGVAHRISRDEGGVLRSPAPALVVATPVAVGDKVPAGAPAVVLESMKMETRVHAPFAATVRELHVTTGSQVETGSPLIRLEPVSDEAVETPQSQSEIDLDLPAVGGDGEDPVSRGMADLRSVVLGFDVDPDDHGGTLSRYLEARDRAATQGADVVSREIELLRVFADFADLSRNRPADEELRTELRVHSPKEHFHSYLQSLDIERGGLPDIFRAKLERVLAHYGIDQLERTPQLEEAVFRIFLAQQRSSPDIVLVSSILQRWHTEPAPDTEADLPARDVLDRLVLATQLRFPVVGDLARSVRFRWFDQPSSRASGRPCSPASAARSSPWPPARTRPTGPSGWRRWPRSRSRSSGSSPNASRVARRRTSHCSRSSSGGTIASTSCTTSAHRSSTAARSPWPTTCSTPAPPISSRRWGRSRSSIRRAGSRARSPTRWRAADPTSSRSSTSTCPGRTHRLTRTSARPGSPPSCARSRSSTTCGAWRSGCARVATGRSRTSPSGPTGPG